MIKPVRIQLSRKRGFNLQALSLATNGLPAVNVARPSKWGNPYRVGPAGWGSDGISADEAVALFRKFMRSNAKDVPRQLSELRGKNLACWCKAEDACHADVLLEIANR